MHEKVTTEFQSSGNKNPKRQNKVVDLLGKEDNVIFFFFLKTNIWQNTPQVSQIFRKTDKIVKYFLIFYFQFMYIFKILLENSERLFLPQSKNKFIFRASLHVRHHEELLFKIKSLRQFP